MTTWPLLIPTIRQAEIIFLSEWLLVSLYSPPPIEKWEIYSSKRESNSNHPLLPLNSKKQICAYVYGNFTAKYT